MPTYYTYGEHNPQTLNSPNAGRWEDSRDWARTYTYQPTYDGYQGYHAPAPVYYANKPQQQPSMYYYAHNAGTSQPTPYYANGYYYAAPQTAPTGYYCYPTTTYPTSTSSNSYFYPAATTKPPTYFMGSTKSEVEAHNAMIGCYNGPSVPTQMAPYKPAAGQQFWCKELDGSWILRTHSDFIMAEISPGYWEKSTSGYPVYIRQRST